MPYTPPSHRSPTSSASTSPDVSRRSSIQHGSRSSLPHSASYLSKHRRSPSITSIGDLPSQGSPDAQNQLAQHQTPPLNASLRQSPPPLTETRSIPNGAVISPPESATSASDDEERSKVLDKTTDSLDDLREAVASIPQGPSPRPVAVTAAPDNKPLPTPSQTVPPAHQQRAKSPMRISFSTSDLSGYSASTSRRVSHSRSATEPDASISLSADNSATMSSASEDDLYKPQMVRKKSGELVRPALRPASRRRPLSMPGTPVFSKAVHFDSHLEHIRHFLQVDRPLAVSAGSSPVEAYDSDAEYPFPGGERSKSSSPPFAWELMTTNFPHENNLIRKALPARLEKVWLSKDQQSLLGSVAVANLAFEKSVTCRFTLDGWTTTSEVTAEYTNTMLPRDAGPGHDRFTFTIQLADISNLACKTLYFCIRYYVNGEEYWDNNSAANFQVDFLKKHLPQNGKNGFQGASGRSANGLPRSSRRQSHSTGQRPVSMPATMDDFADEPGFRFDQPIHEYLGESAATGLRLKSKSTNNLASDNITKSLASPSGAAFANRYDFGASLSAVKTGKDATGQDRDALYMKGNVRGSWTRPESPAIGTSQQTVVVPASGTTLASSSYEELVNKYCFVRTPGFQLSLPERTQPCPAAATPGLPGLESAGKQGVGAL